MEIKHFDQDSSIFEAMIGVSGIDRTIRILQISDSHLCELNDDDRHLLQSVIDPDKYVDNARHRHAIRFFTKVMEKMESMNVDAVVLTGDILTFPSAANLAVLKEQLAKLSVPWLYTLGNHDWHFIMLEEWNDDVRKRAYPKFHALTGGNPAFGKLELGGVLLVCIDNSNYQITEEQLAFFQSCLQSGRPCVLFVHIPLYIPSLAGDVLHRWGAPIMMHADGWTPEQRKLWKTRKEERATQEFYELIVRGNSESLIGIFCGHVHFHHKDAYRPGRYQYVAHPGYEGGYRLISLLPLKSGH